MLPANHDQRFELNDEAHARPSEALLAPLRISYIALLSDWEQQKQERTLIRDLCQTFDRQPPNPDANHLSVDFGQFRLKWERHTEFSRFKFMANGAKPDFTDQPALGLLPKEWLSSLPGRILVATEIRFVQADSTDLSAENISRNAFGSNVLIGSDVAGGAAAAFSDFRIREDGFSRLLVANRTMTPRQSGRVIQRLVEIDTYRMLALLTFPLARDLGHAVGNGEKELAQITEHLTTSTSTDEQLLLKRLTRLAAEIDNREAVNHYRFSASAAYYMLVKRRIDELRENRRQGLQTFEDFIERRLSPAMNTCIAMAQRQTSLSSRVVRATQLLSTRIDVTREQQNQELLRSMDRRAHLQLRLQQTVETFSIAAISYYLVGLISSAAKGAKSVIAPLEPDTVTALSIPIVVMLVILGVWRINQIVEGKSDRKP